MSDVILEKINYESAREKSLRTGHPSTLHLWWARRPLAAARAVIWASLVDDPSSHPELFPTEEIQSVERRRLFGILEKLVVWENSNNKEILDEAKNEILKSTNGNPPALLDPFSGGGAIPLEAQRLGLEAFAHDLNPIAVMINKSMIEIPPKFSGIEPVNPGKQERIRGTNSRLSGLAEDIRYYGEWIKREAFNRVGHIYPKVQLPLEAGGGKATVIAWIWARTAKCENPLCSCTIPLTSSYVISNKKNECAWVEPKINNDRISFVVKTGKSLPDLPATKKGRGAAFVCPCCGSVTTDKYIKAEGAKGAIGHQLMAVIAAAKHGRYYLTPDEEQLLAAEVDKPINYPKGEISTNPRWFSPPQFGMTTFDELFSNRQLTSMVTFSELVAVAQEKVEEDAIKAGMKNDHIPLKKGGTGAKAYGEAVGVYLAFLVDRLADRLSTLCNWDKGYTKINHTYGRQALPMVWDYAEGNPFSSSTGSFSSMIKFVTDCLNNFEAKVQGHAEQFNAQEDAGFQNIMISTDPPYYDNIGYAELSDYFYVWLRQSLQKTYPELFNTVLVPKAEELIAAPYRHGGNITGAKTFFEKGMYETCCQLYKYARDDIPVSIYYAFKQNETKTSNNQRKTSSSGWETMLSAIIQAGFAITGTWPMRTEMANRMVANGTNALSSSIVLTCRKRPKDAPQTTRRILINNLRRELRPALKRLQESNIAPVDLAQSAIGPGMGVFSRYRKVLEADGSAMSVGNALQIINEEIDLYFNEQVGDLDAMSRFCVDLYTQNAFNDIKFGDADILARAKGTSVAALASHDVVYAKAGTVHLIERAELPDKIDNGENCIWMLTQQLTQAMTTGGVEACAKAVFMMFGSNAERAKDLAYRLYTIAEQKKWSTEAFAYNALVVAWPDIQSRAAMMQRDTPEQLDLFSMGLLNT